MASEIINFLTIPQHWLTLSQVALAIYCIGHSGRMLVNGLRYDGGTNTPIYGVSDALKNIRVGEIGSRPHRRSFALLKQSMTQEQIDDMMKTGSFTVKGSVTGKPYKIVCASGINVFEGNARLCASAPYELVPLFDRLLAQKMMIELDELQFAKIAVRWRT